MARRRKPGESAPAPKRPAKPVARRESKKPKVVVRDYMRERYGNY